jgi:hypothetical protein
MQEIVGLCEMSRGQNLHLIRDELKWAKTCVIEALAHLYSINQPKGWLVGALDAMEECERIIKEDA